MATRYRMGQFFAAICARIAPNERVLIVRLLGPGELLLFERMTRFDQRHSLDVYHTLLRGGHTDPLLLRAALLHDCGKVANDGQTIPLLYYGLFVVLERFAPALYRWGARSGRGLLWPFAIHAAHGERSAWLAALAGSPPELVTILNDYAAQRTSPYTAALRWADEQN